MGRDCAIVDPLDASLAANGRLEVTRELFETKMKNRVFGSWEELLAVLSDKPTDRGYTSRHGESSTAIYLDPARIFGWLAALLMNFGVWGLIAFCTSYSCLLSGLLALVYGFSLWYAAGNMLAAQVAGVLWPLVPVTLGGAGLLLQFWLSGLLELGDRSRLQGLLALVWLLPCTALAAVLLVGVREDPDRASLTTSFFCGVLGSIVCTSISVGTSDMVAMTIVPWAALFLGLAFVLAALRLYVRPGDWGSVELVSWTLNQGAFAIFTVTNPLFCLLQNSPEGISSWLAFALVTLFIGMLGSTTGRSFPLVLTALGLLFLSGRIAYQASLTFPSGSDQQMVVCFVTFGMLGIATIIVGNFMQKSSWWNRLILETRCCIARVFGSEDLPYSWAHAPQSGSGSNSG